MPYLALFAIVFGINLLPAFGPPTWAILVFTRLHWHLNPITRQESGEHLCGLYPLCRVSVALSPALLAAGFLDLNLRLFTLAFFLGRLVSYSIYVSVAVVADRQLGNVIGQLFGSPCSIALQVALLGAVCLLPLLNWRAIARRGFRSRS